MIRPWIVLATAVALGGCVTAQSQTTADSSDTPAEAPAPQIRDPRAAAYYYYSIAQMNARAGRSQEAIAALRQAIDRDRDTPVLWIQLAQWLARSNEPAKAVEAAQKAIALDPTNA
ncbi:MAG TPA: tetratricopeptide repeat protein, partial [Methylomirabilota bacterium]|nr:tetratricopeptide repeat protein [Methylomirabilota bacterium]